MLPIWKLLGFFLYVGLYFWALDVVDKWPSEDIRSVVFKLLPMMHLIFVIISNSFEEQHLAKSYQYRKLITIGLIFSAIGDAALVWKTDLLIPGIIAFALAHVFYLCAFGWRPFGHKPLAAVFAIISVTAFSVITQPVTDQILKAMVGFYICLIAAMAWRSHVQYAHHKSADNFAAAVGSTLFMASDLALSVDLFRGSFRYAPTVVMVTYYGAQLGIALSACNTCVPPTEHKRRD